MSLVPNTVSATQLCAGCAVEFESLGDGDLAFDLFETPDGNRRTRVGRLRLTRTAPGIPGS